ncbi:phosphonoacetaldehyde hydrolase [uncultured Metabacillus sp.]|uniref:phosphonoacetaldehyde hydrolase n=1 Tax=uncultured Metabacillus sp. TaxID=2860135 RepID=UPI00262851B1|nr:phosphonoacetaldehyde hydrolase [uncultured Metabacillus sp.]
MMMNKIEGIIFDWAGTTVDYGCFAPLHVFLKVFEDKGVKITLDEARKPMGLLKIEHIRAIMSMPRVRQEWENIHGAAPSEDDVLDMYPKFEDKLFESLATFTTPIPGVLQVINQLRSKGLKIGSTTGYTKEMIEIVAKNAKEKGYAPDVIVTSELVKEGRPYPWMCYYCAMELGIFPMNRLVKVGDTTTDMQEGRNAGMWTVGVVLGSSTLGLTEEEVHSMDPQFLSEKMESARTKLFEAGAHFVIDSIIELPELIEKIEESKQEVLV